MRSPRFLSDGSTFESVLTVRFPFEPESCSMTIEPARALLRMKRVENQDQRIWGSKG